MSHLLWKKNSVSYLLPKVRERESALHAYNKRAVAVSGIDSVTPLTVNKIWGGRGGEEGALGTEMRCNQAKGQTSLLFFILRQKTWRFSSGFENKMKEKEGEKFWHVWHLMPTGDSFFYRNRGADGFFFLSWILEL